MSDELSAVLHEFAAEHETPPILTGAEIRGRAVRRARRRAAGTLGACAAALAMVAFALTLDSAQDGTRRQVPTVPPAVPAPPAASAALSSPAVAVPVAGTIDLGRRTLTVGVRVMPMLLGWDRNSALKGPLTVYKKHAVKVLTVNRTDGTRYNAVVSYAVELRDAKNKPVYVGTALSHNVKGIRKYDTSSGWIALDQADAKWFYEDATTGSVLSDTGTASCSDSLLTRKCRLHGLS
ncbi:hypothetical protein [Streptomyces sp. NPDC007905]|uniref:hypothetical protein n=1 Tax=Streptomyces sp. NPDC007905 TaxID=3364788 RepID=UPI0036EF8822